MYKQFHDTVVNKEWLAQQPLELQKKEWVEQRLSPGATEEERAKLEEEFMRGIKENLIPIKSPEKAFPLYFEKPEQLMELFTMLEEQNLALIQKNQGLLKEIEEKKGEFKKTEARIKQRHSDLYEGEQTLKEKVETEKKRINEQTAIQESKEDEEIAKCFNEFRAKVRFFCQ